MTLIVSVAVVQCGGMERSVIKGDVGESTVKSRFVGVVCAYGSDSERDETEREAFWNDLDDCLQSFEVNVSSVLFGDLIAGVDNEVVEKVIGWHSTVCREEMEMEKK